MIYHDFVQAQLAWPSRCICFGDSDRRVIGLSQQYGHLLRACRGFAGHLLVSCIRVSDLPWGIYIYPQSDLTSDRLVGFGPHTSRIESLYNKIFSAYLGINLGPDIVTICALLVGAVWPRRAAYGSANPRCLLYYTWGYSQCWLFLMWLCTPLYCDLFYFVLYTDSYQVHSMAFMTPLPCDLKCSHYPGGQYQFLQTFLI